MWEQCCNVESQSEQLATTIAQYKYSLTSDVSEMETYVTKLTHARTGISRDTPARVRGLAVFAECLAGGWLAEITADLWEAAVH